MISLDINTIDETQLNTLKDKLSLLERVYQDTRMSLNLSLVEDSILETHLRYSKSETRTAILNLLDLLLDTAPVFDPMSRKNLLENHVRTATDLMQQTAAIHAEIAVRANTYRSLIKHFEQT